MEVKCMNIVNNQVIPQSQGQVQEDSGSDFSQILTKMKDLQGLEGLDKPSKPGLAEVKDEVKDIDEEDEDLLLNLLIPFGIPISNNQGIDAIDPQASQDTQVSLVPKANLGIQASLAPQESLDTEVTIPISKPADTIEPHIENIMNLIKEAIPHKEVDHMDSDITLGGNQSLIDKGKDLLVSEDLVIGDSKDLVIGDSYNDYIPSKGGDNKDLAYQGIIGNNYLNKDIPREERDKEPHITGADNLKFDLQDDISFNPLDKTTVTEDIKENEVGLDENSFGISSKTKEDKTSDNLKDNNISFGSHLDDSTTVGRMGNRTDKSFVESVSPSEIDFSDNIQSIGDSLLEMIDLNVSDKVESMMVKLYPEELGYIDIHLKMEDGKLLAKILVDNEQVRDMFNSHLNQLNQKLISLDINVERLDVDLNFNSNFNFNPNAYGGSGASKQDNPGKSFFANNYKEGFLSETSPKIISSEDYMLGTKGLNILA